MSTQIKRTFITAVKSKLFGKYLLVTNTITSGLMMAIGDAIQQRIEIEEGYHKNKLFDWKRSGHMSTVGLVLGPLQHSFYGCMDLFIPKRSLYAIGQKILLDQLIASPVTIAVFFIGVGYLEGQKIHKCKQELQEKFIPVYITDWCVWPPTQMINFYYLSPKFRVLYVNSVTMLYDIFLSYMKFKGVGDKLVETLYEHEI